MLGGVLIAMGLLFLISGKTALASLVGIAFIIVGGIVFWRNSETKKYLDQEKQRKK
ncbi:hypothetical protein [Adlercreutzia murintestinalis]|jgi:hypothetical protein|uniref:hypothetical protein n=1 Tax=Adlercreutzia murintestinalis TaxID=2941325 RepID=UPI00203D88C3|nr:hypothetical protein [Adlercreutzia murintestinalis]